MIYLHKGHVIKNPDSEEAYKLTRDVFEGDVIMPTDLRPLNGAPEPKAGEPMPYWLAAAALSYE